ncbi:spore cortex biosynthesis protein YabQ [Metabacillus iocasae]|uniref:Spore cortex biosynthesis protein YabQ n=1 Tax=Priestia iocasae TaxID=2291674 RepID=A0ABS2QZJ9_9BACI|nr:spore cortex biosynthesis protein YabQ [Metabacillus iocasae]MBM7704904.1 spore cortex biosynthesis protein YabQ [Metabacillus iocasae]
MSLNIQFYTMIAMISMGSYLGAALDTYRYFFNRSKIAHWLTFINDFLFWILQSLCIFYVLFQVNEGELRFYAFLALLCGFAAYQSLFKQLYLKVLQLLVSIFVRLYRFILSLFNVFLVKPIRWLLHVIILCVIALYKLLISTLKVMMKVVFTPFKWVSLLIWRMMPGRVKKFFRHIWKYIEGFQKKIKNTKQRVVAWIKSFKNKGDE